MTFKEFEKELKYEYFSIGKSELEDLLYDFYAIYMMLEFVEENHPEIKDEWLESDKYKEYSKEEGNRYDW